MLFGRYLTSGKFPMLFNGILAFLHFFQFTIKSPCYSIRISHSFDHQLSMLCNGKFAFCQFSILFNGNFAFLQFPMLFNGNMRLRSFCGGGGWTDRRTDVWKFTPVSYRTSAFWGRCPKSNFFLPKESW